MKEGTIRTAQFKGKYLEYGGRKAEVILVNKRLLISGRFDDVGGYPLTGYCLAPLLLDGDLVIAAHNVSAQDGDIVLIEAEGKKTTHWYRSDGKNTWLESAHGKKSLEGYSILGVALAIARFPSPTMMVEGVKLVAIPVLPLEHFKNLRGGNYERVNSVKKQE